MAELTLSLVREFEAALAWWQAAGVDHDFADDATAWLADAPLDAPQPVAANKPSGARQNAGQASGAVREPFSRQAAPAAPSPAPEVIRRDLLGDSPPADLPSFRQWWLDSGALDTSRTFPRIAPRGEAGAGLMVLVPQPEQSDREHLLEGPQGRLLANILAAMRVDADAVYIASALPSHTPMADLAMLAAGGMDAVLAHHIALAAPRRLLVFGTGLAALLPNSGEQPLREINHAHGKVPVMVSETLDALMEMPRLKARFWKRWMEWSA
jgi:uracil-DNA glycosylase